MSVSLMAMMANLTVRHVKDDDENNIYEYDHFAVIELNGEEIGRAKIKPIRYDIYSQDAKDSAATEALLKRFIGFVYPPWKEEN